MSEVPKELKDKKRKVGDCDFECPNCCRQLHRVLWETATDFERDLKTGKWSIRWGCGPVTAVAECQCGKTWLVAETDFEGTTELFDLTKDVKK